MIQMDSMQGVESFDNYELYIIFCYQFINAPQKPHMEAVDSYICYL